MKNVKWVVLALVLCLGLIGGAYAAWTDQIFVRGSVQTAQELDVRFSGPDGYTYDDDYFTLSIDVRDGGKRLRVLVGNAYPGVDYTWNFELFNHSSVPVVYKGLSDSSDIPAEGFIDIELQEGYVMEPNSSGWNTMSIWVDENALPGQTYVIDVELDWELGTGWYQSQQ